MPNEVLIIVPAYNEAEGIGRVLARIREEIPEADILVVNDGSSDRTGDRAREAGAIVLELTCNLGIGGAVQTGYLYALAHGYKIAAQIDADGQHDPGDFGRMLAELRHGGFDLVVGSRFLEKRGFQSTFARRIGIHMLAGLLTRLLGRRVTDPTSGYRVCGERAIALFAEEYPSDYPEVEALVLLDNSGCTFGEVPVVMKEREAGTSSIRPLHSVVYMAKVILAVLITRSKRTWKWRMGYEA